LLGRIGVIGFAFGVSASFLGGLGRLGLRLGRLGRLGLGLGLGLGLLRHLKQKIDEKQIKNKIKRTYTSRRISCQMKKRVCFSNDSRVLAVPKTKNR
jgi:hypothetical protein